MKISALSRLLMRCAAEHGDVEVHLMDDEMETTESIEGAEFTGEKIILVDLTRAQDNHMNAEAPND